jgi:hypothetical protein
LRRPICVGIIIKHSTTTRSSSYCRCRHRRRLSLTMTTTNSSCTVTTMTMTMYHCYNDLLSPLTTVTATMIRRHQDHPRNRHVKISKRIPISSLSWVTASCCCCCYFLWRLSAAAILQKRRQVQE